MIKKIIILEKKAKKTIILKNGENNNLSAYKTYSLKKNSICKSFCSMFFALKR